MKRRLLHVASMLLAAVLLSPQSLWACPVCFGDPNSPLTHGAKWGVLVLLVVTGGVLVAFASFFVYLFKRSRMMMGHEGGEPRSVQSGGGY